MNIYNIFSEMNLLLGLGISALEVSKDSEKLQTSCGCVMKTIEHQASATVDDLKKVLLKINILEGEGSISPWDDEKIPEEIVATKPNPGNSLAPSNQNIAYICGVGFPIVGTIQVLFTGFSYGGLSEIPESYYFSSSMGSTIAGEIGVFGYRPSILRDMVAGRRVEVGTKLGAYMRTFSGDCSPSDLETALQLVYQLFTKNVIPGEEDAKIVMQMAEEAVRAQERDPYTALADRGKELNYGNCYFFRPIRINDLRKVDPLKACKYFNSCFKDPSTFTVVIVGNLDPTIALPLILQYLGGIPKPPEPILHFNWDDLKGLPLTFPTSIIRQLGNEVVRSPMVEAQCSVQLSFPVVLKNGTMVEEIHRVGFLSKLLETKIMQVLRFKHGQGFKRKGLQMRMFQLYLNLSKWPPKMDCRRTSIGWKGFYGATSQESIMVIWPMPLSAVDTAKDTALSLQKTVYCSRFNASDIALSIAEVILQIYSYQLCQRCQDHSKYCWFNCFGSHFLETFEKYPEILGGFCLAEFSYTWEEQRISTGI